MTRTRVGALGFALVTALVTALGLGACGGPDRPSLPALTAKLRADARLRGLTDAQVGCVAGVVSSYGRASDLARYVAGKEPLDQIEGDQGEHDQATRKVEACAAAH